MVDAVPTLGEKITIWSMFRANHLKLTTLRVETWIMNDTGFLQVDVPRGMNKNLSFYEILDVPMDADEIDIDHAFAKFLQEPEVEGRLTSQRKHAWEVLRDPLNRSYYDEYLAKQRIAETRSLATSSRQALGSMSTFTLGSNDSVEPKSPNKGLSKSRRG